MYVFYAFESIYALFSNNTTRLDYTALNVKTAVK